MSAANAVGLACELRLDLTLIRSPEYDILSRRVNKLSCCRLTSLNHRFRETDPAGRNQGISRLCRVIYRRRGWTVYRKCLPVRVRDQ